MYGEILGIRIERNDKEWQPIEITQSSLKRLQQYINNPGMSPLIDLEMGTLEFYPLKYIECEEPEDCDCKLPEEQCKECVEINGETYEIPY
jgi:hypothetical protein